MKGKRLLYLSAAMAVIIAVALACFYPKNTQTFKEVKDTIKAPHHQGSVQVSVEPESIHLYIKNVGQRGLAQVYAYKANEYQSQDHIRGISKDIKATGRYLGDYTCKQNKTLTIHRYDEQGYDGLYDKYYIIQNKKVLYGPVYATQIVSKRNTIAYKQPSIKGIFNEDANNVKYAKDLGAHSITLNIDLGTLLATNKNNAYNMKVNGQTYYFNKKSVSQIDAKVKEASKAHMNVVAVLIAWKNHNYASFPKALRYNSPKSTITMGTNTSTSQGRDTVIAMMEFLAQRYSQSAQSGLISTYVISNEIDFTHYFYDCGNLNTFMEEYERCLRLSNLAVKKYAADINVAVPFTHYWTKSSGQMFKECPGHSLAPYKMLNWLAAYTSAQGAYDWAIAPHCYGTVNTKSNLAASDVKYKALTGDYKTSPQITFSNFELWNAYLSQRVLKYQGHQRSVYLTESGASSSKNTTQGYQEQAATLAQVYYKVAQMPFVKSFNYYRLKDHQQESANGLSCGLLATNYKQKPAYKVYKYIDTKDTLKYSNPYLKYINYQRNGIDRVSVASGNVKSWKDTMIVYSSDYNWNHWSLKNVYKA